ncbi:putative oxidoreductase dhs-27 [Orchesella cincta]|uniref:Putative oxidoreductase dhs-27 n=1 Tax=Orchesella cincta TaxID=48709 RepID=A0A1D2MIG5_ORCCI|nr:putative oxidoreductase dhs-27 [Orchesella cincta]
MADIICPGPLLDCKTGAMNNEKLNGILTENGILSEVIGVKVDMEPELPAHFTSICQFVTVQFSNKSQENDLELFVKKLKDNAEIKEDDDYSLFEKESNVYTQVMPALRDFCESRLGSTKLLDMFPKVFYVGEQEIIMENLVKHNYVMLDRTKRHSFHEARLVVSHLARFHSASYALIQNIGLEVFKKRFPHTRERMMNRDGIGANINTLMIDSILTKLCCLLKNSNIKGSSSAYKRLEKYTSKAFSSMCDVVEETHLLYVLNHGDLWNNNILFYQDSNSNLTHLKFVDLQMNRVGSPNMDVGYYFYNSLKPQVRRKHITSLLRLYYEEFKLRAKELKATVDFTFQEFLQDYGRISKLGFIFGVYIAAASPLIGKVDLENSKNWIEDFVSAISQWLDNNPRERDGVLQEIIAMTQDFLLLGDL